MTQFCNNTNAMKHTKQDSSLMQARPHCLDALSLVAHLIFFASASSTWLTLRFFLGGNNASTTNIKHEYLSARNSKYDPVHHQWYRLVSNNMKTVVANMWYSCCRPAWPILKISTANKITYTMKLLMCKMSPTLHLEQWNLY